MSAHASGRPDADGQPGRAERVAAPFTAEPDRRPAEVNAHVVTIEPLARHRHLVPRLASWFVEEWPEWYGPGGRGDAVQDLTDFASSESTLPVGVIALESDVPVGVMALKAESLPTHRHLSPWAAAGLVLPSHRGRGIGAGLLEALVLKAGALGYERIYCGTATAVSLLRRGGWSELDTIQHEGQAVVIFCRRWRRARHEAE